MTTAKLESRLRGYELAIAVAFTAVVAGSGCRAIVELVEADGEKPDTGASCEEWSYTPEHFDPCAVSGPSGACTLTPGAWQYDTNSGALTDPDFAVTFPSSELSRQSDGVEARILLCTSIRVEDGAELRVVGQRPLIFASWSTIAVDGVIDLTSHVGAAGAGANASACDPAGPGANDSSGGGGGGGGGFGSAGAHGGTGGTSAAAGGTAGQSSPRPSTVRGGCSGAVGGNPLGGYGGAGGGAIQLTAAERITVAGTVSAGGQGGGAGLGDDSGGGGGGSGGMVGLQAPTVTLDGSAILAANGGGGGGGCGDNPAYPGYDGQADEIRAEGGEGRGDGEDGGEGGYASSEARPGDPADDGGGGGGGGTGYVLVWAETLDQDGSATVTPPLTEP